MTDKPILRGVFFGILLGTIIAIGLSDLRRDDAQSETLSRIEAQVTALEVMTCPK